MNYDVYRFSWKEKAACLGEYLLLESLVSLLFYRSVIPILLFLPGIFWYQKGKKQKRIKERKKRLLEGFITGIQAVSGGMAAGYSVENAFEQALYELEKVYPIKDQKKEMAGREGVLEFTAVVQGLSMNRSLEELLLDLAERSGLEEIRNFAQIFAAAKRSGGSLTAIIRNTVSMTRQREEVRQEIEVCIAGKRMEQRVMSLVPFGILLYVGAASPEFLEGMYHNLLGVFTMSLCLGIYAAAFLLGRHMVDIKV